MATKVYVLDNIVIIDRDGAIEVNPPIAKASGMNFGTTDQVGIEDFIREKMHYVAFSDFQNEAGAAIATEALIRAYLAPLLG